MSTIYGKECTSNFGLCDNVDLHALKELGNDLVELSSFKGFSGSDKIGSCVYFYLCLDYLT